MAALVDPSSSAMLMRARALAIAVLVCASVTGAAAQPPTDLAKANEAFLEGRRLLTGKQTEAACEKFEESIALDPTAPGVMLNLGLCYELLERYATSLYWFRKAQVAAAEARLQAYEDEAKRHTLELATKVSIVRLDASAVPGGTEVRIDGKLIGPTDYARVELDRGRHTLEARADGKQTYRRELDVTAIDGGTIKLPPLADQVTAVAPDPPLATERSSTRGRTILAGAFGVAGLSLCIGSPLWARSTKHAYDEAVANGEMPNPSSARAKQHLATGVFVAGLGLIGLGTYLYLTLPKHPAAATAIAPVIDANHFGIAISGTL